MANTWDKTVGFHATINPDLHSTTGVGTLQDGTSTGDYVPLAEIRSELFRKAPIADVVKQSLALALFKNTALSRIMGEMAFGQTLNLRSKGIPKVQKLGTDCAIAPTNRLGKNISIKIDQQVYIFEEMCPCFSDNPCGDSALYDIRDVATLRREYDDAIALAIDEYVFNHTTGLLKDIPVTTKDGWTREIQIISALAVIANKAAEAHRVLAASDLPILVNADTLANLKLDVQIHQQDFLNAQRPLNYIVGGSYKGTFEGHPVWLVPSSIVDETTGWEIIDAFGIGIAVTCEIEKVTDGGNTSLKTGYVKSVAFGGAFLTGFDNLSIKGKALIPAPTGTHA